MRRLRATALVVIPGILMTLAALPGCRQTPDPWPEKPGPRVLTSFAPLYCFALNVAGNDANVLCVMSETGPHEFDPTPRDAAAVKRADLFIINGLDLDDAVARKITRSGQNSALRIVKASDGIPKKRLLEGTCNCGHDHHDKEAADDHEHIDPHVWLGIEEAIQMVEKIRDELKEKDPAHAAGYEQRAAAYIERLNKLLAEGREVLKDKRERKLLSFHDSLRYFARAFSLEIADSIEAAPGSEPDAKTLSELVRKCREQHIRHIAVEPQYDSNTSAKTIRRELISKGIDAEFVTVDPIETAPGNELNGEFYEKRMRENLTRLAEKLK
jgi:zinc transport system substrate-binding protein